MFRAISPRILSRSFAIANYDFRKSHQNIESMTSQRKRNLQLFMSSQTNGVGNINKPLVIIIAGPTAVGKSSVAAKICKPEFATQIIQEHAKNNCTPNKDAEATGQIISADSVQVYQGLQIGANKPSREEREATPHHLIDIVDSKSVCQYNAADWMRDAMQVLDRITNPSSGSDDEAVLDVNTKARKARIDKFLFQNTEVENEVLPVIVGGTMMYLQWLVHGRPDALKPSQDAIERAANIVAKYEAQDGEEGGWIAAVEHASSLGTLFEDRVKKLPGKDWYRLRRTLEVAYTVLDDGDKEEKIKQLYNGQRHGGLDASPFYDVRCFFLCPDDRMTHTAVVDSRCEEMILKGLMKETSDLSLSGQLPEEGQQARAIGYRQTLEFLKRDNGSPDDKAFGEYLDDFTTATRRYAKKQMQWFRKDDRFIFIPVPLSQPSSLRVDEVANTIKELCTIPREEFEKELAPAPVDNDKKKAKTEKLTDEESMLPLSARTKLTNERQGKNMKFYQNKRHTLVTGSEAYNTALKEATECAEQMLAVAQEK